MSPSFTVYRLPNHTHLGSYTRTVSLHRVFTGFLDISVFTFRHALKSLSGWNGCRRARASFSHSPHFRRRAEGDHRSSSRSKSVSTASYQQRVCAVIVSVSPECHAYLLMCCVHAFTTVHRLTGLVAAVLGHPKSLGFVFRSRASTRPCCRRRKCRAPAALRQGRLKTLSLAWRVGKMVELAGIEPASSPPFILASTCL